MTRTLYLLTLVLSLFGSGQAFLNENETVSDQTGKTAAESDRKLSQIKFQETYNNPYRYFRQGEHHKIKEFLLKYPQYELSVFPIGSLDSLSRVSRQAKNFVDYFIIQLLRFGHLRRSSPAQACRAVRESAFTVKDKIGDPKLALEILKLGQVSDCPNISGQIDSLDFFLENDWEISKLLSGIWTSKPQKGKQSHAIALISAIEKYPSSRLRARAMREVCSIYYRLGNYPKVMKWGRKAIKSDPQLVKWQPMQVQLKYAWRHILKKRTMGLFIAIYLFAGLLLVYRWYKADWQFNSRLFVQKSLWLIPLFAVLTAALFLWDSKALIEPAQTFTTFTIFPKMSIFPPIVPLSILDFTYFPNAFIVLAIGFLPVLYSLIYSCVKAGYSSLALYTLVLIVIVCSWTHFFLIRGYDGEMMPAIIYTKSRIYLHEELDTLMMRQPGTLDKKLRPYIEPSRNSDLVQFIQNNLPEKFKTYTFPDQLYSSDVLVDSAYRNSGPPSEKGNSLKDLLDSGRAKNR